ncbi:MAG: redoxin domain-containing protein [candidate division Zixibacteria bacterium]|nr:redoxin domain-containing protein [candidate division Zixibacteria bacterium]
MTEEKRLPGRIVILAFGALLVIALVGAYMIQRTNNERLVLPVLGDVPEFSFTAAHTEEEFSRENLLGKISVMDFIFTRCPGVCPVMADKMGQLYQRFERHDEVQFVSVTVDPEYDSLSVLREYADAQGVNDDRWIFLRGPIEEVVELAEGGLKLPMGELPAGHSSKFVLIDSKGQIRGYYNSQDDEGPLELQHHLRALSGAME